MTIEQTLDDAYFEWLLTQVRVQHGSQTYRELCWALYKKEFIWFIPNDDNRIRDGQDLLVEFFHEHGLETENVKTNTGCSCLELVIGLSRRLAFLAGGDPVEWAWHLLGNLGLHSMSDPLSNRSLSVVDEILERVIGRTYRPDGRGGFFPLRYAEKDQREVELWYQLNAYVELLQDELVPI
jgi:hypothetical protein